MPLLPAESTEIDRSHPGTLQMPALANADALNASLPTHPPVPSPAVLAGSASCSALSLVS